MCLSALVLAQQRRAGARAEEQRCPWLGLAIRELSGVPGVWLPTQLIPPGKKKKKDAGDSGTSHQGPFPAKKGLRGRNHFVIHGIAVRCFLLTSRQQHSWYRFLTGELT